MFRMEIELMYFRDSKSCTWFVCCIPAGVSYDTPVLRQADLAVRANEQSTGRESPCCLPAALQEFADGSQVLSTSR